VIGDAAWRSLTSPTLFLVGENEKIYSAQEAVERLRRVAPQVQAEIIPGAGNDLTIVQAETVNQKIMDFLKK
jgi:pimeloyl-ACP methyl ester carboxylesterase